jgi:hypothetical protein
LHEYARLELLAEQSRHTMAYYLLQRWDTRAKSREL